MTNGYILYMQIYDHIRRKICSIVTKMFAANFDLKMFAANFDLIISPVSLSDDALYQCQVRLLTWTC